MNKPAKATNERICLICGERAELWDQNSGDTYCRPCGSGILLNPKPRGGKGVLLVDLAAVLPRDGDAADQG